MFKFRFVPGYINKFGSSKRYAVTVYNALTLYSLNVLTTKTNVFISVTTLIGGKTCILKTSRMLGYSSTERRAAHAGRDVLDAVMEEFFLKYTRPYFFIITCRGSHVMRRKQLVRRFIRRFKKRVRILYIVEKQFLAHNGCPLEARRRKKNKGRNRGIKRKSARFLR